MVESQLNLALFALFLPRHTGTHTLARSHTLSGLFRLWRRETRLDLSVTCLTEAADTCLTRTTRLSEKGHDLMDLRENPPHTALMKHRRCLLAHLSSLYRREIGVQIHFCFTDGHCVGGIAKIYHNMLLKSSASGVHTLMTANPSEAISWNCITLKQWVTVGGALLSSTARVAALMWCVPVMETHFLCGTSGWVRRPKTTSAGESRPTSSLSTSWLQPRISPGGRQSHGWVGVHSHFLGFWLIFWVFVCRANNVKLQPITFT